MKYPDGYLDTIKTLNKTEVKSNPLSTLMKKTIRIKWSLRKKRTFELKTNKK